MSRNRGMATHAEPRPPERAVTRSSRLLVLFSFLLLALLIPFAAVGQEDGEPADPDLPEQLAGLSWRGIGPAFMSGRISEIAIHPGDKKTWFVAVASGGVWKSVNGGLQWKPVFDDQPVSSTGSIAVAPSDPNVVYVGAGEANPRGNVAEGNGIYRSTDAGTTFTLCTPASGMNPEFVTPPLAGTFDWDTAADVPGIVAGVIFRMDVFDGTTIAPGTDSEFRAYKFIIQSTATDNNNATTRLEQGGYIVAPAPAVRGRSRPTGRRRTG